ncbi:adenosine kinase [Galendromus occidentalis]|uniref:Adenosine kinase n=1 Tax=Galendromus occidentalis TaxID=34638 RepID=A0AAJ7PAH0_9ACAR|nr:adenosine kinase [Galendromus occidentalis]
MSELPEGVLFCMGNPLLDISAEVDKSFLERFGLKANDAILAEEKHVPMYRELQGKTDVDYVAGGATQNTCRVFQWVVRQRDRCVYMGCIGKDEFGNILAEKAREAGVNVRYQINETTPTGTCAVLLTDGGTHRSLCANLAAANCFTLDHLLKEDNLKLMENAQYYYISGFFLTVSVDSMLHVGKHATAKGKPFCMNLSAPFLCGVFSTQMMSVMPYVDILFGNESEAAELAKAQGWPSDCTKEIAKRAEKLPKESGSRLVVFTQGCDPVIVIQNGAVTEYPVERIPKEDIIDTNGAGDSFVGGFLAGYVQVQKTIAECVALGVKCASMMIRQSGCSLPDRKSYENALGF